MMARGSQTLLAALFMVLTSLLAGGECSLPPQAFNKYTNDFYFSAAPSTEEGAPGEVIAFDVSLTIQDIHEECVFDGGVLIGGYDPTLGEVLGEPLYSESFWDFGGPPFFFELRETQGLKGFVIGLPVKRFEDPTRFIGIPINIGTLYFRLRGPLRSTFELSFPDDRLTDLFNGCMRNQLTYLDKPTGAMKLKAHSRTHSSGIVNIIDREPILTEPPPLPPDAKVYPQPVNIETAAVRFQLVPHTPTVKAGDRVPVDLYVTSSYEFIGYLAAGRFPKDHLSLERIELLTTAGSKGVDNEQGVFWLFSSNSLRRMGAEAERVHAARLYFRVSDAARDLDEIRISLGDVREGERLLYKNRIVVLQEQAPPREGALKVDLAPVFLGEAVLKLNGALALRGDANFDGQFDLSDPVSVISYAFLSGPAPECPNAADFNLDRTLDLSDPISMLSTLFLGAAPPGGAEPHEVSCR